MQMFGEIPFVKTQHDTETTDKRLMTMKNERKRLILFCLGFAACSVLRRVLVIILKVF